MTEALIVDRVSKRYGDFQAVRDLSFSAKTGQILGFLGPNGAGKTSTLRMVLGLMEPSEGKITVLGADDARHVRSRIGFLPEERGLYRRMTAIDAITFFARAERRAHGGGPAPRHRPAGRPGPGGGLETTDQVPVQGHGAKGAAVVGPGARTGSGAAGRTFLRPGSGQSTVPGDHDPGPSQSRGHVVFSTHVMQHAERLCDHVVLMARGRKVFDGSVAQARAAAPRRLILEGALDKAAASALPGVSGIEAIEALEGGERRITATLEPGVEAQGALKAAFAGNLDLRRFDLREPTLHDAFIVLTGGEA